MLSNLTTSFVTETNYRKQTFIFCRSCVYPARVSSKLQCSAWAVGMFQNIDTSVLDETTGLKLLNYLARNDDNGRRGPRSRKELFRLKSTDAMSAEDFSIRQLKEKENQQAPKASSPKRSTLLQDQSSLFVSCNLCPSLNQLNDANPSPSRNRTV